MKMTYCVFSVHSSRKNKHHCHVIHNTSDWLLEFHLSRHLYVVVFFTINVLLCEHDSVLQTLQ